MEKMTRAELETLTVKELRRYAINCGLGIKHLNETKKAELIEVIVRLTTQEATSEMRAMWDQERPHFDGQGPHRYLPGSDFCEYCLRPKDHKKEHAMKTFEFKEFNKRTNAETGGQFQTDAVDESDARAQLQRYIATGRYDPRSHRTEWRLVSEVEQKPMGLTKPTIHLNGSSAETLAEGYALAESELRKGLEALQATAPHGRDYYVAPGALEKAETEHHERLARIQSVIEELKELRRHVVVSAEKRQRT